MIKVKNLVKSYKSEAGTLVVLKGIDFEVQNGEFVAVTGRSGSGKSTLLYQLGLLDQPDSGSIIIDNLETTKLSAKDRTNMRLIELGYVFQDYALIPSLTALENVMVPLLMQGFSQKVANSKAEEALIKVGLKDKLINLPSQLSGGQQQRVSIARAIGHSPKIIFADEPTANLDTETSDSVMELFTNLNKSGQTIVIVTHEPEYAQMTDRTVVLSDGVIV